MEVVFGDDHLGIGGFVYDDVVETVEDEAAATAGGHALAPCPGLVMHCFGSKEQLFARATETPPDEPVTGSPEQLTEQLLATLHAKLTDEPTATLAMLRSMLTHPEAAEGVRSALNRQRQQLGSAFPADDATLRTGLTGAITLGVTVGRHLLQLDGLRDAPPERIVELLRPCIESLTQAPSSTGA